jgi:ribokinase
MPLHITVIGSLNVDLVMTTPRIPTGGETLTAESFTTHFGGKGANQAVAAARGSRRNPVNNSECKVESEEPGILVKMIGAVGSDSYAPEIIKSLQCNTINTSDIKVVDDQSTGVAIVIVEHNTGDNRILLSPGANHCWDAADFLKLDSLGVPKPQVISLQLEIPVEAVLQILRTARRYRIPCILNPAPAVPLPDDAFEELEHLIVNESEAAILSRHSTAEIKADRCRNAATNDADYYCDIWAKVSQDFHNKGAKNVIITLGANGAYCSDGSVSAWVPPVAASRVVDTTAAGDTFAGVYAIRCAQGLLTKDAPSLREDVAYACKAASKAVEVAGAQSSIPWRDDITAR